MLLYLFRALQLGFFGGAVVLLWNTAFALASSVAPATFTPLELPPVSTASSRQLTEYQVIDGRNLFKVSKNPKPQPVVETVAPSRLQFQLLGTVAGSAPELSAGILKDLSANKTVVVGIGQKIANNQAKVVRIEQRRIILEKDGRLEALEVVQKEPRRSNRPRGNSARGGTRPDNQRMLENMRRFGDGSSMASSQTPVAIGAAQDGYFTGVQVQQVSGLAEFGIEPGDKIMTVDGVQLNDPSVVPGVLQSLGRGQPKVVGIDRNGSNVEIEIPAERILDVLRALRLTP